MNDELERKWKEGSGRKEVEEKKWKESVSGRGPIQGNIPVFTLKD
jgi:hypothetical protein